MKTQLKQLLGSLLLAYMLSWDTVKTSTKQVTLAADSTFYVDDIIMKDISFSEKKEKKWKKLEI